MKRSWGAALTAAALLTLTACAAPSVQEPTPTEPGQPDSPTPTATADPAPVQDPADLSTWIISADGIGPLRLGQKLDEVIAAATALTEISKDRNRCPNPAATFLGSPGQTMSDSDVLVLADESGTVFGIDLVSPGPHTPEGLEVGSPISDVTDTYPSAVASARQEIDDPWTLKSDPGWITFQYLPANVDPTVDSIAVLAGSTPPREYCG